VVHFVKADLIASGLSPLRPEVAAVAAGRLFLKELESPRQGTLGLCLREHVERAGVS